LGYLGFFYLDGIDVELAALAEVGGGRAADGATEGLDAGKLAVGGADGTVHDNGEALHGEARALERRVLGGELPAELQGFFIERGEDADAEADFKDARTRIGGERLGDGIDDAGGHGEFVHEGSILLHLRWGQLLAVRSLWVRGLLEDGNARG
jgi:hypothetical protein